MLNLASAVLMTALTAMEMGGVYAGIEGFVLVVSEDQVAKLAVEEVRGMIPLEINLEDKRNAVIQVDVEHGKYDVEVASGTVKVQTLRWMEIEDSHYLLGIQQCHANVYTSRVTWARTRDKALKECLARVVESILANATGLGEA